MSLFDRSAPLDPIRVPKPGWTPDNVGGMSPSTHWGPTRWDRLMAENDVTRSLLLGLLAIREGVVKTPSLMEAFDCWCVERVGSFDQFLRERGLLTGEQAARLMTSVDGHSLSRNGDEGSETVAYPLPSPVLSPRTEQASPWTTRVANEFSAQRFEPRTLHAEGGLGRVYRAVDREVGREVALKTIREERADDPESQARFLLEGKVTGMLEHPGIVPVYGMGRDANDRPYYAMRLIRGQSLKEAILEYHGQTPRSPARLRELLGRLVQVCQAVEYAHSRGVIHRDLKPENIMLGPFGEALAVDWGLARVSEHLAEETSDGSTLPPWQLDGTQTGIVGRARGTLAYMSPEQAAGSVERMGPASDVYSLGATLYCLITGRAPRQSTDPGSMLDRAIRGEFPNPAAVLSEVDPDLERICLKAMARDPGARYASPRALAEALDDWLAEERARAVRDLFSMALDSYAYLIFHAQDRLRATPALQPMRVELLSTAIRGLEDLVRHAERSAEVGRSLAAAHLQIGDLVLLAGQTDRARQHYEHGLACYERLVASDPENPYARRWIAITLGKLGDVRRRLGDLQGARADYLRGLEIMHILAEAEPESPKARQGLSIAHGKLGDLERQLGDLAAARDHYQRGMELAQAAAAANPKSTRARRGLAIAYSKLGDVHRHLGDPSAARDCYRRAADLARALVLAHPGDSGFQQGLAIAYDRLGDVSRQLEEHATARQYHAMSLDLAESLVMADPTSVRPRRGLSITLGKLGDVCLALGDVEDARAHISRSFELARGLAGADADDVQAQISLVMSCQRLGKLELSLGDRAEAHRWFREGRERIQAIAANGRLAPTHELLANELERQVDDSIPVE